MANEKPILFSAPMVRAILDGTKTQTRRLIKPQPGTIWGQGRPAESTFGLMSGGQKSKDAYAIHTDLRLPTNYDQWIFCPYGTTDDQLWVRETFAHVDGEVWYAADGIDTPRSDGVKLKPSIFMPRIASRITLNITGIRAEPLQAISEEDAKAEGVQMPDRIPDPPNWWSYKQEFEFLWNKINGAESWEANPFVWAIELRRIPQGEVS